MGEQNKMITFSQGYTKTGITLNWKPTFGWSGVIMCQRQRIHTGVLVQFTCNREQSNTATATITTEPCSRPSYSHFVPDRTVQSSLKNLFSAIRRYFCFYPEYSGKYKMFIQSIKYWVYCSGFQAVWNQEFNHTNEQSPILAIFFKFSFFKFFLFQIFLSEDYMVNLTQNSFMTRNCFRPTSTILFVKEVQTCELTTFSV